VCVCAHAHACGCTHSQRLPPHCFSDVCKTAMLLGQKYALCIANIKQPVSAVHAVYKIAVECCGTCSVQTGAWLYCQLAEGLLFPFAWLLCLGKFGRRWGQMTGAGKIGRGLTNRKQKIGRGITNRKQKIGRGITNRKLA